MTNAHFTDLAQYQDIESLNWARGALERGATLEDVLHSLAVKSRDNARTPVQWDASPNAGFTTGTPWLAVNPNHAHLNAEAAAADPDSVLHHYRRLIALRHTHDVVVHGDYRLLLPADEQVFAYVRALGAARLLVAANLSGTPATVDLGADAALLTGEVLVATHEGPVHDGATLTLAPWESFALLS